MENCKIISHIVLNNQFTLNEFTKKELDINVDGSSLIPKNIKENKAIIRCQLNFNMGNETQMFTMHVTTETKIEVNISENPIEVMEKKASELALNELLKSVQDIMKAVGIHSIDIPSLHFERE